MFSVLTCVLLWVVIDAATDPYIIVGRNQGIDRMNLDGSGKQEVIRFDYPRFMVGEGLDYDYERGLIFYAHGYKNSYKTGIRRCSLSGQDDRQIVNMTVPENDIWVDTRTRTLYRLTPGGFIFREDYEGSEAGRKNLFKIPGWYDHYFSWFAGGIPMHGKFCWAVLTNIFCGNMDGSDITPIILGQDVVLDDGSTTPPPYLRSPVVDDDGRTMYFAITLPGGNGQIRSVELETHEQRTIITGLSGVWIRDMWLHEDHVYFTASQLPPDVHLDTIHFSPPRGRNDIGSVMRCDKAGGGLMTLSTGINGLRGIVVIQPPSPSRPTPVDGGWGDWSPWSACSTTCGRGSRGRERYCNRPAPAHGGSFCVGPNTQTKSCNIRPCASYEYILFARRGGISLMNMDGTEIRPVVKVYDDWFRPGSLAYDASKDIVFYTTYYEIRRCRLSGEDNRLVATLARNGRVGGITLLPDIKKIYTTSADNTVVRLDYEWTNAETLISGVVLFGNIVVSHALGRIFLVMDARENIFSSDLDGGDLTLIRISQVTPSYYHYDRARNLALDEVGGKLYFIIAAGEAVPGGTYHLRLSHYEIRVMDLETYVETPLMTSLTSLRDLQMYNGRLYFSQAGKVLFRPGRIQSCDTSGNDLKTHFESYHMEPYAFVIVKLVDAAWSDWSVWTACTETCGDGIRTRTRTCTGSQCYGQNYEIQECNESDCAGQRATGWENRRSQAVCLLFTAIPSGVELFGVSSALPASFEEEDEILSCKEECEAKSMTCARSLRLYPDPAARLARREEQVHSFRVFERCNTKWANICCCLN